MGTSGTMDEYRHRLAAFAGLCCRVVIPAIFLFLTPSTVVAQAATQIGNPADIFITEESIKKSGQVHFTEQSPASVASTPVVQQPARSQPQSFQGMLSKLKEDFSTATGKIAQTLPGNKAAPQASPQGYQPPQQSTALPSQSASNRHVAYAGYSAQFLEVKQLIRQGRTDAVFAQISTVNEATKPVQDAEKVEGNDTAPKKDLLTSLEHGNLALAVGDTETSITHFTEAEEIIKDHQEESVLSGGIKDTFSFVAETLIGNEEIMTYKGEGYERVLMLNMKSIAYLLNGDRRAYNVTRRAIDWQNLEKQQFDIEYQKIQAELAKEKSKQAEKAQENENNFGTILDQQYAATAKKAETVPSAYVNPFGYYLAGVIQEFESVNDRSLRDNALISYRKALELNPDSEVIKNTIKDLEKNTNSPKGKLVHIIVGEGFVPEKKVLTFSFGSGDFRVPIKLPIYEPDPSQVDRIVVHDSKGKQIAAFSPVADIEAICLRHQKDMQPFYNLMLARTVGVQVVERVVLTKLAGSIGSAISARHDEMRAPDTRSWMSLPATIQAARFRVPQNEKKLTIASYDRNGKKLASQDIELQDGSHSFAYVRSIDQTLYSHACKPLWLMANN